MIKTGLLPGGLPFVRLGNGDEPLVILPGLGDAAWDVTEQIEDVPEHYRAFAETFTVYLISRKRGMPAGYTTQDMAADYATAFDHELRAAHVLGISMGGCIAQHLAAQAPQLVRRLALANAAHEISPAGRLIPERWLALARQGRWRQFYFDIAKVTLREFHHTFYQFLRPLLRHTPTATADFLVSLEACLRHDGRPVLPAIQTPTLVIGGAQDIFFPELLLREAHQLLPRGTLRLTEGSGHGSYELNRSMFESAVIEFLRN